MSTKTISLTGSGGKVIFHGMLAALPLKEERIISKSIEMFNDSDPCIIHKTYVMKKIMLEIDDYLNSLLEEEKLQVDWKYVPQSIKQLLDLKDEINEISVTTALNRTHFK